MAHAPQNLSDGKRGKAATAFVAAGTLFFHFFCAAATAAPSWAQMSKTEFSASDAAPVPFAAVPTQDANGRIVSEPLVPAPPLSRVRQNPSGSSDATRAVNYLTSVSSVPSGETWLGTHYGVKRVGVKTVRYYGRPEGLPGDYVEAVAAAPKSAWCLVRIGNTERQFAYPNASGTNAAKLAFCAWDAATDKWRVIQEIPSPLSLRNYNGYNSSAIWATWNLETWQGKSVMTADAAKFVGFAPRVVSRDFDALFYLWDKQAKKVRAVPWEPNLRSSQAVFVGISFLHFDDARQTLWVGTSQGLMAYHIPDGTWRTFLKGRVVSAGAVSPDKTALYVTCRLRDDAPPTQPSRPAVSAANATTTAAWQLLRVALPTGETTEMPPPPSTGPPYSSRQSGGYNALIANEPVGVFVDEHRTVWATLAPSRQPSYNGDDNGACGIEKFDQTTRVWQHIALIPFRNRLNGGMIGSPFFPGSQTPPAPDPVLVQLDTVPSGALLPLAFSTQPQNAQYSSDDSEAPGYPGESFSTARPPAFWIRHRFPHWYGTNDDEASRANPPYNPRPVIADSGSASASDTVWLVQNSDTLLRILRADLGPNDGVVDIGYRSHTLRSLLSSDRAEFFPLNAAFPTRRGTVQKITRASGQNPALLLAQNRGSLFVIDSSKNEWSEVAPPDRNNGFNSMTAALSPNAPGDAPLFQMNSGEFVRRWNAAANVFETAADLPVPSRGRLMGLGLNGAVWFSTNESREVLWYQVPTPPTSFSPVPPVRVAPDVPAEWAVWNTKLENRQPQYLPRPFAAQGSRAWYKVAVREGYFEASANLSRTNSTATRDCLAGYDTLTQKWTLPLPLPRNVSENSTLLSVQNRTYAATTAGNPNGTVWEWNDTNRNWDVVAPPLPPETGLFDDDAAPLRRPVVPAAVDDKAVWVLVLGRMMARFDRAEQTWTTWNVPAPLREKPDAYYGGDKQVSVVQTGPNVFCVSSQTGGLWRFRASGGTAAAQAWELLGRQVVVRSRESDSNGGAAGRTEFFLNNVTVTPQYVWVSGHHQDDNFNFAGRLNKQTKTWTVWDEQSGYPAYGYLSSMIADGDGVWVNSSTGAYRYDEAANRWTLMVRSDDASFRAPEQAAVFLGPNQKPLTGRVWNMAGDEAALYLLFNTVSSSPQPQQGDGNAPAALVWRWDKAAYTMEPVPFSNKSLDGLGKGVRSATALLSEPGVLWVGTSDGLLKWDKTQKMWSTPPHPADFPTIVPTTLRRSGDALVLVGRPDMSNGSGAPHTVRLSGPDFLKRP